MKICVYFPLCFVIYLLGAAAEPDNEVKRGIFPFMGFVYYQDASVVDESGERFRRGAVLIRTSWLLTASLDHNNAPLAFPQKTLLARLGTVNIDTSFNFNEDEEEQEREVIQIVHPYNFNSTQWWFYDVSLLKTLFPFNITSVIAPITPHYKRDIDVKTCKILVYTRSYNNASDDKILMQLSVELLSPSTDCGDHYQANTMMCGADSEDNKNFNYGSDYCQGNGGGPLLCEGEVIGLQTYVNDNCKQPHLFQHLPAWENFISCGIDARCYEKSCNTTCTTINKDSPVNEIRVTTSREKVMLVSQSVVEYSVTSSVASSVQQTVKITEESDTVSPTLTAVTDDLTTATSLTENAILNRLEEDRSTTWTDNKIKEQPKSYDQAEDTDNMERKTNVEAQHQMIVSKVSSAGCSYIQTARKLILNFLTVLTVVTL